MASMGLLLLVAISTLLIQNIIFAACAESDEEKIKNFNTLLDAHIQLDEHLINNITDILDPMKKLYGKILALIGEIKDGHVIEKHAEDISAEIGGMITAGESVSEQIKSVLEMCTKLIDMAKETQPIIDNLISTTPQG